MLTLERYDKNVVEATIVCKVEYAETYRALLKQNCTFRRDEISHDPKYHVFVVEGLPLHQLYLFDKNDGESCFVHFYSIKRGKYLIELSTIDTSRQQKYISYFTVYHVDKKDGKDEHRKICEVYAQRTIGEPAPSDYWVNWGAWGSMNTKVTAMFIEGMQIANEIANQCIIRFVK